MVGANVLHALRDELVCGEARGQARQPARRRFVFLGNALAQAHNLAAVVVFVHETGPSFFSVRAWTRKKRSSSYALLSFPYRSFLLSIPTQQGRCCGSAGRRRADTGRQRDGSGTRPVGARYFFAGSRTGKRRDGRIGKKCRGTATK